MLVLAARVLVNRHEAFRLELPVSRDNIDPFASESFELLFFEFKVLAFVCCRCSSRDNLDLNIVTGAEPTKNESGAGGMIIRRYGDQLVKAAAFETVPGLGRILEGVRARDAWQDVLPRNAKPDQFSRQIVKMWLAGLVKMASERARGQDRHLRSGRELFPNLSGLCTPLHRRLAQPAVVFILLAE